MFSFIFHMVVREKVKCNQDIDAEDSITADNVSNSIEASMLRKVMMTWKCWLKERQFYQVC